MLNKILALGNFGSNYHHTKFQIYKKVAWNQASSYILVSLLHLEVR